MHEAIRDYIVQNLCIDDDVQLAFDEPIFSGGLVDSFGVVELMGFIAATYDVEIDPSRTELEDMDTVNGIVDQIAKYLAER